VSALPRLGDRIRLACSCDGEVVVPLVIAMPRHAVARIVAVAQWCRHSHHLRQRVVMRWAHGENGPVFADIDSG
jgi:hypothetical protein